MHVILKRPDWKKTLGNHGYNYGNKSVSSESESDEPVESAHPLSDNKEIAKKQKLLRKKLQTELHERRQIQNMETEIQDICTNLNRIQRSLFSVENPHEEKDEGPDEFERYKDIMSPKEKALIYPGQEHQLHYKPEMYDARSMDFKIFYHNNRLINNIDVSESHHQKLMVQEIKQRLQKSMKKFTKKKSTSSSLRSLKLKSQGGSSKIQTKQTLSTIETKVMSTSYSFQNQGIETRFQKESDHSRGHRYQLNEVQSSVNKDAQDSQEQNITIFQMQAPKLPQIYQSEQKNDSRSQNVSFKTQHKKKLTALEDDIYGLNLQNFTRKGPIIPSSSINTSQSQEKLPYLFQEKSRIFKNGSLQQIDETYSVFTKAKRPLKIRSDHTSKSIDFSSENQNQFSTLVRNQINPYHESTVEKMVKKVASSDSKPKHRRYHSTQSETKLNAGQSEEPLLIELKPQRPSLYEDISNSKSKKEKTVGQKIDHRKVFEFLKKRKKEEAQIGKNQFENKTYLNFVNLVKESLDHKKLQKDRNDDFQILFNQNFLNSQNPNLQGQRRVSSMVRGRRGTLKIGHYQERDFYTKSVNMLRQDSNSSLEPVDLSQKPPEDDEEQIKLKKQQQKHVIEIRNKYVRIEIDMRMDSKVKELQKSQQHKGKTRFDLADIAVNERIKQLQEDLKKVINDVTYDIYNPSQMTINKILLRHQKYAKFFSKHGHCNEIDKNQNQHKDTGSDNDSFFFGEDELTEKQQEARLKELYRVSNNKKLNCDTSSSEDSDSDSDCSVGSNTRRQMHKSDSENDLDYHLEQAAVKKKVVVPPEKKKIQLLMKNAVSRVYATKHHEKKLKETDHERQRFVGENAILNSMHKYLASRRLAEISDLKNKQSEDPLVHYYHEIQKKGIIPRGMGFVNKLNSIKELNIQNQYVRPDYIEALSKGVKYAKYVTDLKLKDTHLDTEGATKVIRGMAVDRIKTLDVSHNPDIGVKFYKVLGELLENSNCSLEVLNFEGNRMGDTGANIICESISHSRNMKVLNLSKNLITDKGVPKICGVLEICRSLQGLFLHNNQITGPGGILIAQQLKENKNLEVLDISMNAINGGKVISDQEKLLKFRDTCAQAWSDCFQYNKSLIHVDIQNNGLRNTQMEIIANGLKYNHTILGIHVQGNDGFVDPQGFIDLGQVVENSAYKAGKDQLLAKNQMLHRIHKDKQQFSTGIVKSQMALDMQIADNCWICEGWVEVVFEFKSCSNGLYPNGETSHDVHVPVFLHLELDNYKPDLMLPEDPEAEHSEVWRSYRRIPPGRQFKYFFSINDKKFTANDQALIKQTKQIKVLQSFGTQKGQEKVENEDLEMQLTSIDKINRIQKQPQDYEPYTASKIRAMNVRPRERKRLGPKKRGKSPWRFETSAFRNYKPDTQKLLDKCFEFDWQFIEPKVEYLIKDEKDRTKVKKYLKSKYKYLRDAYKQTSGEDAKGNAMSIGRNAFSALMSSCGDLVDGQTLKLADVDLGLIAVKAADAKKGNKQIPVDQLIRYNFLEVQIRLADQKFIKSGQCKTYFEAIKKMLEEYILPKFQSTDSHIKRKNVIWREECDLSLKRQYRTIQKLYNYYSGRFAFPSAPQFVSPVEFAEMIEKSRVVNDYFTFKEIYPIWNLSMMTQEDEINSDKHLNMNFTEFIEAICRVSDKLSVPHLIDDKEDIGEDFDDEDMNNPELVAKWSQRPIGYKIESFLLILAQNCLGQKFYKDLALPTLLKFKADEQLYANDLEVSGKYKDTTGVTIRKKVDDDDL